MLRAWVRLQLLVLLVPVLLIGAGVALVVTGQPPLADARNRIDTRWSALRAPLATRYDKLAAARDAFVANGGADRDVVKALAEPLRRWQELARVKASEADDATEEALANTLEAAGARLAANVTTSDRFAHVAAVTDPLVAFQGTVPPVDALKAYNHAVRRYERDRNRILRKPVAFALGFDQRPVLQLAG